MIKVVSCYTMDGTFLCAVDVATIPTGVLLIDGIRYKHTFTENGAWIFKPLVSQPDYMDYCKKYLL